MLSPLALVTGGASGLGLALVTCLKQRGYDVVLLNCNADAGKDAAKSTGSQFIECDVANAADWERVVTTLDHPDCVIERAFLNAGVMTRPPSASLTDDIFAWMDRGAYERVMSINVAGALLGLRAVSTLTNGRGFNNGYCFNSRVIRTGVRSVLCNVQACCRWHGTKFRAAST